MNPPPPFCYARRSSSDLRKESPRQVPGRLPLRRKPIESRRSIAIQPRHKHTNRFASLRLPRRSSDARDANTTGAPQEIKRTKGVPLGDPLDFLLHTSAMPTALGGHEIGRN